MKTAAKNRKNTFHQPSLHITTADFAEISPVNILFTQPNEHYKINVGSFARMAPLAVPTFGSFKSQILAFFVPMHTISDRFNAFANRSEDASQKKLLPSFTNDQIFSYFIQQYVGANYNGSTLDEFHALVQRVDQNQASDFSYTDLANVPAALSVESNLVEGQLYYKLIDKKNQYGSQLIDKGIDAYLVDWNGSVASNNTTLWSNSFSPIVIRIRGVWRMSCYNYSGDGSSIVPQMGDINESEEAQLLYQYFNSIGVHNGSRVFWMAADSGARFWTLVPPYSNVYTSDSVYTDYYSQFSYDDTNDDGSQVEPSAPVRPAINSYYKFTTRGRWLYKVLLSLGYGINWTPDDRTELSFLPLKAYFRCLFDYIYPSAYVHKLALAESFTDDDMLSRSATPLADMLDKFMQLMFVPYDQDFYTQAWKNFNSVTNEDGREGVEYDVPNSSSYVSDGRDGSEDVTLTMAGSSMTAAKLSATGLRLLQAVADFVTRKNISGTRFFERAKAMFGFSYEESKHPYSFFLKSWSNSVDISDVTATTGAEFNMNGSSVVQQLGEQAGKGVIAGNGMSLSFDSKDYGFLVFLHRIVPNYGYYQGRKPWTLALKDPNQLFTPDFDNLGMQPIRNDELYAEYTNNQEYNQGQPYGGKPDGVWGFSVRYNEYTRGFDYLTGDFRCKSRNEILKPYHMMRNIPIPSRGEANGPGGEEATETSFKRPLVLGLNFLFMRPYEFDRIFATDSGEDYLNNSDHILCAFRFDVASQKAISSMSDRIPLFDKSGRDATFNYEGTQI